MGTHSGENLPERCNLPWSCLLPLQAMCDSENPIITQCFDRMELTDKKRPETVRPGRGALRPTAFPLCGHSANFSGHLAFQAVTQFKNSLLKLMEILMSKEPSYVRCIKPNHAKQAGRWVGGGSAGVPNPPSPHPTLWVAAQAEDSHSCGGKGCRWHPCLVLFVMHDGGRFLKGSWPTWT